jgi:hypothetical protein
MAKYPALPVIVCVGYAAEAQAVIRDDEER